MNENEKKKNNVRVIILIIILVLALLGTSSYIILDKFILKSNVEDKSEKENVEEEQEQKEELSLTDSSFSRILDAVSDFTLLRKILQIMILLTLENKLFLVLIIKFINYLIRQLLIN